MKKWFLSILIYLPVLAYPQEKSFARFTADSSMDHSVISFCLKDAETGSTVFESNSGSSLIPGSVLKIITSAVALEILGPDHTFKTVFGYSGKTTPRSGKLDGNIIIKGGGDPALGSENFIEHYDGFADKWVSEITKTGIKRINGRVITDDSYFDYRPVPSKWLWEDAGNYYGAGAYGLSVFDNTYAIHFNTTDTVHAPLITGIYPEECRYVLTNRLTAAGTQDKGFVFAAPYTETASMEGTIPSGSEDFILKASIPDPPLVMAKIIDRKLRDSGIMITGQPTTTRMALIPTENFVRVYETVSPPLKDIIRVLNHESINLYAEHLVKELGRTSRNRGTTEDGLSVIMGFLKEKGLYRGGLFMEDGSGLSPLNTVTSEQIVEVLRYIKRESRYFDDYISSFPDPGKEGTLRNYFRDPIFASALKAKSGSMTRVRAYAGYLTTMSGKNLVFCIIVNNFDGPSRAVVAHIEEILKEVIVNR